MQNNPEKMPVNPTEAPEEDIYLDFKGMLLCVADKWRLAVKVGLILAAVAFVFGLASGTLNTITAVKKAMYTAVSKIYVVNTNSFNIETGLEDFDSITYLLADCREIINNRQVREEADRRLIALGYGTPVEKKPATTTLPEGDATDAPTLAPDAEAEEEIEMEIEGDISVRSSGNSRVIYITATAEGTLLPMDMANTYADVAVEFIPQLMPGMETAVFEYAEEPEEEISKIGLALDIVLNIVKLVVLAFVAGVFLVCAVLALQFLLDDRIRSDSDVERNLGLSVIGRVPMQGSQAAAANLPKKERAKK